MALQCDLLNLVPAKRQDLSLKDVESRKQMMVQSESNNSELPLEYLESDGVWVLCRPGHCVHVHGRAAQGRWRESGSSVLPGGTPQLSVAASASFSVFLPLRPHRGSGRFQDVQRCSKHCDISWYYAFLQSLCQKKLLYRDSAENHRKPILLQIPKFWMETSSWIKWLWMLWMAVTCHWTSMHIDPTTTTGNDWQRLATTGKCTTRSITKATHPSHWICLQHANRIAQGKELCNGVQYLQCHYGRTSNFLTAQLDQLVLHFTALQLQLQ